MLSNNFLDEISNGNIYCSEIYPNKDFAYCKWSTET